MVECANVNIVEPPNRRQTPRSHFPIVLIHFNLRREDNQGENHWSQCRSYPNTLGLVWEGTCYTSSLQSILWCCWFFSRVRVLFPSPFHHPTPPSLQLPIQEDFLRGKIKIDKKTGKVGKSGEGKEVTLSRDKNEIRVETEIPFSKRLVPLVLDVW